MSKYGIVNMVEYITPAVQEKIITLYLCRVTAIKNIPVE